jgi:hypothetical protein
MGELPTPPRSATGRGGRRRRPRAPGGRPHSVNVWLSDLELAAVTVAAARAGRAVSAWVGEAAFAAATQGRGPARSWAGTMQALMMASQELADARRLVRNVGGNLNDVAAHANATGDIHAGTRQVLGMVARAVARIEAAAAGVAAAVGEARVERLRGPR